MDINSAISNLTSENSNTVFFRGPFLPELKLRFELTEHHSRSLWQSVRTIGWNVSPKEAAGMTELWKCS